MNMLNSLRKYLREKAYYIGFVENDPLTCGFKFGNIKWLDTAGYDTGWFADPFIFEVSDDKIVVLAEEFVYETGKGRLVRLDISRDYKLEKVKVILELDTHLSFPIFHREGNEVYVYPENAESGKLSIYRYNLAEERLEFTAVLVDEPLLDSQIYQKDGKYILCGVIFEPNGQECTRRLQIYESDKLTGPYVRSAEIANSFCEERGAGAVFQRDGRFIRPAQCCEGDYGKGVILYDIDGNTEREIARYVPESGKKNGLGLHTFNQCDGLTVVDGIEYRHRVPGRLVAFIFRK